MRLLKLTLVLLFVVAFCLPTLANANVSVYMPPAQISCFTVSDFDFNHCEGFNAEYLTVTNHDSNIPKTPVILNFTRATADYYGHPVFDYNDSKGRYVSVLGPANFRVRAKIDDSAWVKKGERYSCVDSFGQCPIYLG